MNTVCVIGRWEVVWKGWRFNNAIQWNQCQWPSFQIKILVWNCCLTFGNICNFLCAKRIGAEFRICEIKIIKKNKLGKIIVFVLLFPLYIFVSFACACVFVLQITRKFRLCFCLVLNEMRTWVTEFDVMKCRQPQHDFAEFFLFLYDNTHI